MPTNQDETLPQRYAREHQDYIKLCGSMTAEQVADLQLQLNNSLAREQALQQRLTASDELLDTTKAELAWQESDNADLSKRVAELLIMLRMAWVDTEVSAENCRRIDVALKPAQCCTISPEQRALLEAGDYTPEELFGVGGKPSCPKCAP